MGDIVFSDVIKDIIINIINIIVLFVIVRALIYKPVKRFLSEREERIRAMQADAQAKQTQTGELLSQQQLLLEQSRAQAAEIISGAESDAKQEAGRITNAAKQDALALMEKTRADMAAEREHLISSLREEVTGLSLDIAKRVLKRECRDEDNRKIAEEFFSKDGV